MNAKALNEVSSESVHTVCVGLQDRSYQIVISNGFLEASALSLPSGSAALVITNETVYPLYAERLIRCLKPNYGQVHTCVLPDGECFKSWETLQQIFNCLLENSCDRKTVIYALGGGVIGDMAGFAAACYMRGVPFVQVPTTLLSQVDSSVGGKTGINHPLGKNMIGAFYQPQRVICELSTLQTLPDRELSAGLAEVIKYGPIADMDFLAWVEANLDRLLNKDLRALGYAVKRSCEIKAAVVGQDERESGIRAILNFGHTFGHAIEAGMGYGAWLHGEAVGCGMVMAARLSEAMGLVDAAFVERLRSLVKKAGLPVVAPMLSESDNAQRYLELMRLDKKAEAGDIRFVLVDGTGQAFVRPAPEQLVRDVIGLSCQAPQARQ